MTDTVLHVRDTVANKIPCPSTLIREQTPREILVKQVANVQ